MNPLTFVLVGGGALALVSSLTRYVRGGRQRRRCRSAAAAMPTPGTPAVSTTAATAATPAATTPAATLVAPGHSGCGGGRTVRAAVAGRAAAVAAGAVAAAEGVAVAAADTRSRSGWPGATRRQRPPSRRTGGGGTVTPTTTTPSTATSSAPPTSSGRRSACARPTPICSATSRGKTVLEVGCGAAMCSRWLAAQGAYPVAFDISAGMLRHARAGARRDRARRAARAGRRAVPAVPRRLLRPRVHLFRRDRVRRRQRAGDARGRARAAAGRPLGLLDDAPDPVVVPRRSRARTG